MARVNLNMRKGAAFILDAKGLDRMFNSIAPQNRKRVLKEAMDMGSRLVQMNIRATYSAAKPNSDLYKGIVRYIYPSAEGAVVRRFYIKRGRGRNYDSKSPLFRSYILNFLERGATARLTRGKGARYYGKQLNRGSIPALKFFQKGRNKSRQKAFREIERFVKAELTKQAQKG